MADENILKDTLEVTVNGQAYLFKIPSYLDEIKLGVKEKSIRRDIEAALGIDAVGDAEGLDNATYFLVRVAAQFEVLLKQGPAWAYSTNATGGPVCDYKKWPNDKVNEAITVGAAFQTELARFRDGGLANGNADGTEAVEGEPTP